MSNEAPHFITAKSDPNSGSHSYIYGKKPAETVIAAAKTMGHWLDANATMWQGSPFGIFFRSLSKKHEQATEETLLDKAAHSPEYAKVMVQYGRAQGGDTNVNKKLNYQFFTHNHIGAGADIDEALNGSLNAIDANSLLPYFTQGTDPHTWPNLILTSSHALVKDHKDVSSIMKGLHALVRDSFANPQTPNAHRLNLLERTDTNPQTPEDGKASIMVSSVFNNHNAWVNGGTLLLRLHELDALYKQEQAHEYEGAKTDAEIQHWRERRYLGHGDTAMSPASIRMAKLMLTLIVSEPNKVHMPTREDFEGAYKKDLTQSYNQEPLTLRADAAAVLQHMKLMGYSKGGNIMTDALRYLSLELMRSPNKQPLISLPDGDSTRPIRATDVKALLMNTGLLALNPGISPLTDHEKAMGIRRLSVRNPADWITAHLFNRAAIQERDGTNDDIYEIKPKQKAKDLGHNPEAALGNMDNEKRGYFTDAAAIDSDRAVFDEITSRIRCFLASCHGKSGIKHVQIEDDLSHTVHLEFSAGASQEDTDHVIKELDKALTTTLIGFKHELTYDWHHGCQIALTITKNGEPITGAAAQRTVKQKLGEALASLEKENVTYIGHNIYTDLGVAPPARGRAA